MNFIQRAIKNISRKWSKSILLLITFFVIGNFVIVGLGVAQASEGAKTLTRQKMRAVVNYNVDHEAADEYAQSLEDEDEKEEFYSKNYPKVEVNDISDLLKDERVLAANATLINQVYTTGDGLESVKLNNKAEEPATGGGSVELRADTDYVYVEPDFSVKANFYPNMIEFQEKSWDIKEGRFYNQEELDDKKEVCLISEALAELNGLKIGDTISVYSDSKSNLEGSLEGSGLTLDDFTMNLEIIGIYNHNNPITPDMEGFDWVSRYENPDNVILMPATTLGDFTVKQSQLFFDKNAKLHPEEEYYSNPENRPTEEDIYINAVNILLNDPLEVNSFVEEYEGSVGEFKKISANNEEFERLSKPLDTLSLFASFIVYLVVINAIVITTLVTALTLKTREYEIGVLLSIGVSKAKVVAQFFVELAIVAILGFTLSVVSGSLIANKVGATVLDYQISTSDIIEEEDFGSNYPSIWEEDYTTDITLDDLVAEYNVSVSPMLVAEIYVLGVAIVLVSTIIPSMMIMRYSPKRILTNRN